MSPPLPHAEQAGHRPCTLCQRAASVKAAPMPEISLLKFFQENNHYYIFFLNLKMNLYSLSNQLKEYSAFMLPMKDGKFYMSGLKHRRARLRCYT